MAYIPLVTEPWRYGLKGQILPPIETTMYPGAFFIVPYMLAATTPKRLGETHIKDFWHISWCNTIYKVISKLFGWEVQTSSTQNNFHKKNYLYYKICKLHVEIVKIAMTKIKNQEFKIINFLREAFLWKWSKYIWYGWWRFAMASSRNFTSFF